MNNLMENLSDLREERKQQLRSLRENNRKIETLLEKIQNICDHEWVYEREPNLYGERFIYCKHCKKGQ